MNKTMKTQNKVISKSNFSAAVAIFFLSSLTALANEGGSAGTRGGGHPVAMEFVATARVVMENLNAAEDETLRRIDLRDMEEAIEQTKIQIEVTPIQGGKYCSFAEPALKKIRVYPPCFKEIARDVSRQGLVLHDYLRIMGLDDDKNQISSIYTAWMMKQGSDQSYPSCLDVPKTPEKGAKCRTSKGVVLTYLYGTSVLALNDFTCRRWEQRVSKKEVYEWSFGCDYWRDEEDANLSEFRLATSIGVFEVYRSLYPTSSRPLFRVSREDANKAHYVVTDQKNCKYDSRLAYDAQSGGFECVRSEVWSDFLPKFSKRRIQK